jgi:type II secretory pathway pseudopilin PulG
MDSFDSAAVPVVHRGSTPGMLEALVALSIIVALAGVVMPLVGAEARAARTEQAFADMQSIAGGLKAYSRDTRYLPTGTQGRTNVAWLYGPGLLPEWDEFGHGGEVRPLRDVLLADANGENDMGGDRWAGPYVNDELRADPWGHAFIVYVDGWVNGRKNPFILSAGPDGLVQTRPIDRRAAGDDLIYHLH